MLSDAKVMIAVRALVSDGMSISGALDVLNLSDDQRGEVQALAEAELGLEVIVGPGIAAGPVQPWLADRQIDGFHWERLQSLLSKEGKLPVGAVRTLDNVSRTLLERMPPPDLDASFRWMGMVVGSVQSGKTATFTALISKAADVGYQLFIVLSGMLNTLRLQTQLRLSKEILGTTGLGGIEMPAGKKWHPLTQDLLDGDWGTPGGMGVDLLQQGQTPCIAVVKKNVSVMANLNDWLENIELKHPDLIGGLPVMIIDDESDEASIDTSGGPDPSSTNRELRRLLEVFRKRSYVGFTATPYANCFIPDDKLHRDWGEDLYPGDFILPLRTSKVYTGSEKFFGRDPVWDGASVPPLQGLLQVIPETELELLVPQKGKQNSFMPQPTICFRNAVLSFFLAGAARRLRDQGDQPCTMLVHLSRYRSQHRAQREVVTKLYEEVYGALSLGNGRQSLLKEFEQLWDTRFRPTIKALNMTQDHEFADVGPHLKPFVEATYIRVVNQDSDDQVDFTREPALKAIVIGGQNLGRGLTLEGLVTTIFLRPPGNQSTAMQMQRWCGYRDSFLDLIRIYTTGDIAEYYREFVAIEEEMRDELRKYERDNLSPGEVGMRLRQHPDVPLVSAAKQGAMRPLTGQYSGKLPQTTVFPMGDVDLLELNCKALADLIGAANAESGEPPRKDGKHVWKSVSPPTVLDFLAAYKYPSRTGRTSFQSNAILHYIKEKVKAEKLTDWTIALCGIQTAENGSMADLPLTSQANRIARGLVEGSGDRLGVITDPEHEAIGLETNKRGRDARRERPDDNGLLLIYPIKHPQEADGEAKPTIVGVAISFSSKLKDPKGTHVTGSVALEDELAAD